MNKLNDLNYRLLSFFIMASYKPIIYFENLIRNLIRLSLSFIQPKILVPPNFTVKRCVPGNGNAFLVTFFEVVTLAQPKSRQELKIAKSLDETKKVLMK